MKNESLIPELEIIRDELSAHTGTGVHLSPSQVVLQINRINLVIRYVRAQELELQAIHFGEASRKGAVVINDLATEQLCDLATPKEDNVVRPMFGSDRRDHDAF